MNLKEFESEIKSALGIINWSPTEAQLTLIANEIKKLGNHPKKSDVESIVLKVVGSIKRDVSEGLDNSDLITLLSLATRK